MNRSHMRWPLVFGIVVMATTASRTATSHQIQVAVKDRANAYASLAAAGPFAAMAWGASSKDGATDIYVAVSRDGGRAFAAPTRVAGDAKLSGEQPPRVALVPRAGRTPSIVVVWTTSGSTGARLLSARSDDGGRTFAPPVQLPGSDASGNRGWESIATNRAGEVVALWLDHRESSSGPQRRADESCRASTPRVRSTSVGRRSTSATLQIVVRTAGRRRQPEGTDRWRLLLLQNSDRHRLGRCDLRGVATRVRRQRPRHRVHEVVGQRPQLRSAGASQRRQLGARRLPRERTGDGRRRGETHPHRVADARAWRHANERADARPLLCDVARRQALHGATADSDRGRPSSSPDDRWPRMASSSRGTNRPQARATSLSRVRRSTAVVPRDS